MIVIGLCGGSGSGKGTVCSYWEKLGVPSIDTDAVYHTITAGPGRCLSELSSVFGDRIINSSGGLDRRVLADIVFSSADSIKNRILLNEITHRHILSATRDQLAEYERAGYKAAIVDAPLLFESGVHKECDVTVAVIADREARLSRIIARDGLSLEAAQRRINSQMSDEELISRSDYVINNNGATVDLAEKVRAVHDRIFNN